MEKIFTSCNVKVRKIGNSHCFTLPKEWKQILNFETGDYVKLELSPNRSEVRLII